MKFKNDALASFIELNEPSATAAHRAAPMAASSLCGLSWTCISNSALIDSHSTGFSFSPFHDPMRNERSPAPSLTASL